MLRLLFISVVVQFFICYLSSNVVGQVNVTAKEKVYIHTDRVKYGAGETIFFSAYHYDQGIDANAGLSRVLYVELINEAGEQIEFQWLKIYNGRAVGSMDISYQLESQVVTLRAYTKYMRNYDEAFFFRRQIKVVGLGGAAPEPRQSQDISVQAFPEGGELINDIASIVGVKMVKGGKGISGVLELLKNDKSIDEVETNEHGFGRFVIKPEAGSNYSLIYNDQPYELPEAKQDGVNIRVRTTTELFTIFFNAKDIPNLAEYSSLIIAEGQVLQYAKLESAILKLSKATLPTGLVTVAILDPDDRPICERLLFNHFGIENQSIATSDPVPAPSTRSLVKIPIDVRDIEGNPIAASLSAAVVDHNYHIDQSGIAANFLLQSEIKGRIENPDQYLIANDKETIEKTDLLLLTQGWRRYNWSSAGSPQYDKERGISLRGRTVKPKKVTEGVKTYGSLSILDENFDILQIETDDQGYFEVGDIDRFGIAPLFFQVGTKKPKDANTFGGAARGNTNVDLLLDKPTSHAITDYEIDYLHSTPDNLSGTEDLDYSVDALADDEFYVDEGLLLDEVTIKAKKVDEWVDYYDDVISYSPTGNRIFTDNIASIGVYRDIYDILRGRVAGIEIVRSSSGQSRRDVIVRGSSSGLSGATSGNNAAGFLLNGSLVSAATAESISPIDIAFIDVIKGLNQVTQFGSVGSAGIIAIYLKPPGARSNSRTSNNGTKKDNGISIDYQGYSGAKEFYKTNYGADGSYEQTKLRRTIHWEPLLQTYQDGSVELQFYTADYIGTYHIDIQGISEDGTPMSHRTSFTVR